MLVVLPVAAVLAALLLWLWGGRYVTTENAYVKADIAQISAEVAGRVNDVLVQDHAEVRAGDVLLTLDREPFRVAHAMTWLSSFCWSATAPRWVSPRCTPGCRTRTPRGRHRSRPCSGVAPQRRALRAAAISRW